MNSVIVCHTIVKLAHRQCCLQFDAFIPHRRCATVFVDGCLDLEAAVNKLQETNDLARCCVKTRPTCRDTAAAFGVTQVLVRCFTCTYGSCMPKMAVSRRPRAEITFTRSSPLRVDISRTVFGCPVHFLDPEVKMHKIAQATSDSKPVVKCSGCRCDCSHVS